MEVTKERGRRILVVVTGGGYTNASPLLELASILASRGYTIDFATLDGRQGWLDNWTCVSQHHVVGSAIPAQLEEVNYLRMSRWPDAPESDWATIFESRKFLESSWPEVYAGLKGLVENPQTRPDFILADYLVDAARDVSREYDIPLAMHWPQMPTAMLPAPHIPGTPGLQVDVLTSEFATFWQRLRNALLIYTSLPWYLSYLSWGRQMRKSMGVSHPLKAQRKPDYLCLVNSFFALEAAKDLPPNVAAIGPVLSDELSPLSEPLVSFLSSRSKVLYISLGTHVLLSHDILVRLLSGALSALDSGLIDGIIWSIRSMAKRQLRSGERVEWTLLSEQSKSSAYHRQASVSAILNNEVPSLFVTDFAPQRAILDDARTVAFLGHCGSSSTNEATFAGKPIIALPVYFDQLQYAMRLRDAGVAIALQKDSFQAADVAKAIATIVSDRQNQGPISTNVQRVMRIARISARRKHFAADLVEEVLVDWEGRRQERAQQQKHGGRGGRQRSMHLQTADMRLPTWKANNWDLYAVGLVGLGLAIAVHAILLLLVVLPLLGW